MLTPKRLYLLSAVVVVTAITVSLGGTALRGIQSPSEDHVLAVPPPALDQAAGGRTSDVAVLAGGCFWGVQAVYQHTHGVLNAVSGYAGGEERTAVYEAVGTGRTGHAEAVRITYDPRVVSYGRLLQLFFSVVHDPTELNRQGPDVGPQYRSTVFPSNDEQARIAKTFIDQLTASRLFGRPIATTIEPGRTFYPAEDYHQDFLVRNPTYPYIVIHDLPKIENLKRLYPDLYRSKPALVGAARRVSS
jgi:peptide-methionine (S)-S-oxide reductase